MKAQPLTISSPSGFGQVPQVYGASAVCVYEMGTKTPISGGKFENLI